MCEEGGFFAKHQDAEKADGMFATLIIQLPSLHTGGTLIISHAGEEQCFPLGAGKDAPHGCHFVAHCADCEHEIMLIESGHRLALICCLCFKEQNEHCEQTAASVLKANNQLKDVIGQIPKDDSIFLLPLDHQCTHA